MLARPALLALALAAFPLARSPRFAPPPGSSAEKRFRAEREYSMERIEQEANGQQVELPRPTMEGTRTWSLVVTDRYVETRDGRPLRLERAIGEVEAECEFEMEVLGEVGEYGLSMASDLAGAELVARFDPDRE